MEVVGRGRRPHRITPRAVAAGRDGGIRRRPTRMKAAGPRSDGSAAGRPRPPASTGSRPQGLDYERYDSPSRLLLRQVLAKGQNMLLVFVRSEAGEVTHLLLRGGGNEMRAKKMK